MKSETKNCQNCKKDFVIEPEDFNFYEKIKVPPPTFCPECRIKRRMSWRNERSLFKRNCAKTRKQIISMFHPEVDVVVYDHDEWWSDRWEPTEYGQNYDFSRPFFEQFQELLKKVPLANLGNSNSPGSPYGNHNLDCKNCYLLYAAFDNERVHYSTGAVSMKDCLDTYNCAKSELSYEDVLSEGLYTTHYSYDADECINSSFLKYCKNLQNCIGCVNLVNKHNSILNVEYSKEEYEKKRKDLDLGSYKVLTEFKNNFSSFSLSFPYRYSHVMRSVDSSGDNIINAKNAKQCFDIYGDVEDSKYLIHVLGMKDSYDIYGGGAVASLMYEGLDVGLQASKQLFSAISHSCSDVYYTYMCYGSKNLFGCIGLRGKSYCIFNKQYSKGDYEKLVPKIIEQMNQMPFTGNNGRMYRFGEFFPTEISPFAYNETVAQEYFTMDKNEIIKNGYAYRPPLEKDYHATLQAGDLPDHIKDVPASILDEVIACPNNGQEITQCTQAFRIIKPELDFLKNHNLALPRYCPNCRHYQRLKQRNPMKLWTRQCMCEKGHQHHKGRCDVMFETSYAPERPEIVYCEKCYQQEVY